MITFGANWCVNCRTLYKTLGNEDVVEYTRDRFTFVNVYVGEFNRNIEVAIDLGSRLRRRSYELSIGTPVGASTEARPTGSGSTNQLESISLKEY